MDRTTSIELSDPFVALVERRVAGGRHGSPSDVIRAGLRLLEEQEAKLEALRAALIEGEQSGPSTPFDLEEFLDEMHRTHAAAK